MNKKLPFLIFSRFVILNLFNLQFIVENICYQGELDGKKNGEYTEDERKVLRETSNINGRDYVPFISADLR